LIIISSLLSACSVPQYKWVNSVYSPAMVEQNLVIDQGDCNADANVAYTLPVAVHSPEAVYRQCLSSPFVRRQVIRRPDYAAYVNSAPDLQRAYANRQDRSLSKQAWGERSYLNNGRANGRRVPIKQFVTYPVCDEHKRRQQYQYNEYARIVSIQRNNRSEYVNSCMTLLGWQRIQVEEGNSSSRIGGAEQIITERYANGKKSKEGIMINGQPEGLWTEWTKSGTVVSQGNYLNGKKDGPWIEYDNNGQKRNEKIFNNGNLQNETHWNEEGQCLQGCE
jgi:hypothetical protein